MKLQLPPIFNGPGRAGSHGLHVSPLQGVFGQRDVGGRELRLRLYELPLPLSGILEASADEVRHASTDPVVRRRALVWKAEGTLALYTATLRSDPLAGAADLWGLLYQMEFYFEEGPGVVEFGPHQPIAVAGAKSMVALFEGEAQAVSTDPARFLRRRALMREFARAHPILGAFASRPTALVDLAHFLSDDRGTLASVGQATDTLADITLRLNAYLTLMPKLARWEAELAAGDITGRENLGGTLDDVHAMAEVVLRADALLADLPGTVRIASVPVRELLDQQRAEIMTGVDALTKRSIDHATERTRQVVNYIFWRALILVAVSGLLFVVAYVLLRGHA